jgi:hypothetical protein
MAAELRFSLRFATVDTARPVEVRLPPSSTVAELKARVISSWPAGAAAPDAGSLKLFVMGRALDEDAKQLAAFNLPAFDFPTPVHVMSVASSGKGRGGGAAASPTKAAAGGAGGARAADDAACCTIA